MVRSRSSVTRSSLWLCLPAGDDGCPTVNQEERLTKMKVLFNKLGIKLRGKYFSAPLLICILLLLIVDFAYPVTLTYDSGHYLWLANVIDDRSWILWDPVRYPGFPLYIFLSQQIIGDNINALLLPMVFSHLLLFLLIIEIFQYIDDFRRKFSKWLIYLLVFIIIILDPIIVGYFHTLLTEYFAALIAMVSCLYAIKMYKSPFLSKRFFLYLSYFILATLLIWHVKQLYVGAAFFPLLLSWILIYLKSPSRKKFLYLILHISLIILLVVTSTLLWNSFLIKRGNKMNEERTIPYLLNESIDYKLELLEKSFLDLIKNLAKQYLVNINLLSYYDFNGNFLHPEVTYGINTESIAFKKFSLTYGFQNEYIAQRSFLSPGVSNLFGTEVFDEYTSQYETISYPPAWINGLFVLRSKPSNFLFTVTNLLLPIYFALTVIFWFRKKSLENSIMVILSGSSLFNIIIHLIFYPIDRYIFWSYPINLLLLVILMLKLFLSIQKRCVKNFNNRKLLTKNRNTR